MEFRMLVSILGNMIDLRVENVISICFQHKELPLVVSLKDDHQTMDEGEDPFLKWSDQLRPLVRWFSGTSLSLV